MWVALTQRAQNFCSFWTMGSFAPVEVLVPGSNELTLMETNVVQIGSKTQLINRLEFNTLSD